MIGLIAKGLISLAIHAIPTMFGFGTLMGTDRMMKYGAHESVGPWVVKGMSALQRARLIDVANQILSQEPSPERTHQFMNHQMQIIATCVRNRFGYILFDPANQNHLYKLMSYPVELLDEAYNVACRLSGLDYLVIEPENKPESVKAEAHKIIDEEDDGLDFPEEQEKDPNPS